MTTTTTMLPRGNIPIVASQASNNTVHDQDAAASVTFTQISDISDFSDHPTHNRRNSHAGSSSIYNSPGPIPQHRRKAKSRSSSVASNRTIPGESQVFSDIDALSQSRSSTPTDPRPFPVGESENTPTRRRIMPPPQALDEEEADEAYRYLCVASERIKTAVKQSVNIVQTPVDTGFAGNLLHVILADIIDEIHGLESETPLKASLRVDLMKKLTDQVLDLPNALQASTKDFSFTPGSTQASLRDPGAIQHSQLQPNNWTLSWEKTTSRPVTPVSEEDTEMAPRQSGTRQALNETPANKDGLSQILEELRKLNNKVNLVDRRMDAMERKERKAPVANTAQTSTPAIPPKGKGQDGKASFGQVAAAAADKPDPKPVKKPETQMPKAQVNKGPNWVRFTFRCGREAPEERESELVIDRKIKSLIDRKPSVQGRLVRNEWNEFGNLVLTFTPGSNAKVIASIEAELRNTLGIRGGTFGVNKRTSKVCLHGVATGTHHGQTPFTPEQLLDELCYKNDIFKKLTITQQPDWVIAPDKLGDRPLSTISVAFEDNDDSKVNEVLSANLTMFGRRITSRKWENKKTLRGCERCLSYEHLQQHCKQSNRMTELEVHCLQLNVAKSNWRQHALLNDHLYSNFNLILIQDPWWGCIGRDKHIDPNLHRIYGTVNSPNWSCLIPPGITGPQGPGVVIYIRKGIHNLGYRFSDLYPPHPDVLAIDIYFSKSRTTIVNAYLHGERYADALQHLISHPLHATHPHIVAGDFNTHHPGWALAGSKKAKMNPSDEASSLHDWFDENQLYLFNDQTTPTRRGRGKQEDSIIDLTLLNSAAVNAFLDFNWECGEEGAADSDHNAITWTLSPHEHVENDGVTEPSPVHIIDETLQDEWVTAYAQAIDQASIPSQPSSAEEAERSALGILEAMTNATRKVMPLRKMDKRGVRSPWWNDECSHALRALKDGTRKDPNTRTDLASALRGAIRRARRTHADRVCQNIIMPEQVFKVTNWYKGKRRAPLPPIRFQGNLATHPADKAKAFAEAFFPKEASKNISLEPLGIPETPKRTFHKITHEEIQNALNKSSNTSAPGAFGSNYRLLKWAFKVRPDPILQLYNACLRLRFHPTCLRNAVISIIPKPRRPDMAVPKAYRPISLLETLSKCLEKVITSRLLFEAGKYNLIPHSQFGGRDMTSCTDAGLCLTHDIRTLWAKGKHVSLLTMDVSGYFNNIDHARLNYTLDRLGYADEICGWIASYLTNRTAQPKVDDFLCDPIALPSVGVPQGSPLSPVLSSLYSIPLLRSINDPNAHTFAYVDDFSILVFSNSHSQNVDLLHEISDTANHTLIKLGLDFEIPKSELIHFTAPRQQPSYAKLVIYHPDGSDYTIEPRDSVRWLGFYLDRKLDFKDHVRHMRNKANAVLSGLSMLANSVRGLSVKHARLLYKACVLPILTYGSLLWFHGRRQKSLTESLEKAQNVGIRWLLGAFKSTPIRSMEHLASIPPMHVHLHKLRANAAAKLRALPQQAELARRLPASWDTHDRNALHTPRRRNKPHPSPIVQLAELAHPQSEPRTPYLNPP
ncbi:reverse transcriptase, partial [Rhizoctonia solani 123E]